MDSIRTESMVDLVNSHVKMPCDSSKLHLKKLEWRCRGCFSISSTKETRIAILENDSTLTLIYPDRFSIVRESKGFGLSVKPTLTEDSGIYFCLVNGREEPFSAFRLAIQGRVLYCLLIMTVQCFRRAVHSRQTPDYEV